MTAARRTDALGPTTSTSDTVSSRPATAAMRGPARRNGISRSPQSSAKCEPETASRWVKPVILASWVSAGAMPARSPSTIPGSSPAASPSRSLVSTVKRRCRPALIRCHHGPALMTIGAISVLSDTVGHASPTSTPSRPRVESRCPTSTVDHSAVAPKTAIGNELDSEPLADAIETRVPRTRKRVPAGPPRLANGSGAASTTNSAITLRPSTPARYAVDWFAVDTRAPHEIAAPAQQISPTAAVRRHTAADPDPRRTVVTAAAQTTAAAPVR